MTGTYEIDITRANALLAEWSRISNSIARQCKWRPQGKCLIGCLGLAVCKLEGLTPVNGLGNPVTREA